MMSVAWPCVDGCGVLTPIQCFELVTKLRKAACDIFFAHGPASDSITDVCMATNQGVFGWRICHVACDAVDSADPHGSRHGCSGAGGR